MSQPNTSFARIVQQDSFPNEEQAITLDSIDGHTVQEYTVALGNLINPSNILHVSRISLGRICFYLTSNKLVDKLIDNETKVNIGESTLIIRPLVSKAKRIIISNASPIIPHSVIENELKKIEITPVSGISFVRAGLDDLGYEHILSFNRQMYIRPDDVEKLLEIMPINFNGTQYWIYFSTEKLSCSLCKEEGHLDKDCKNVECIAPLTINNNCI